MANEGLIIGIVGFIIVVVGIIVYLGYDGSLSWLPRHLFTTTSGCKNPNYEEYHKDYVTSDETFCKTTRVKGCTKSNFVNTCTTCTESDDTLCIACTEGYDALGSGTTMKCLNPCPTDSTRDSDGVCECAPTNTEWVEDDGSCQCKDGYAKALDTDEGCDVCADSYYPTTDDGDCILPDDEGKCTSVGGTWDEGTGVCTVPESTESDNSPVECDDAYVEKIDVNTITSDTALVPYFDGNFFCKRKHSGDSVKYGIVNVDSTGALVPQSAVTGLPAYDTPNDEYDTWANCHIETYDNIETTKIQSFNDDNNHQYSYKYSTGDESGGTCYLSDINPGSETDYTYDNSIFSAT